ncbi:MAG: hypothetical protein V1899_03900 [Planctomycetota bacterium]
MDRVVELKKNEAISRSFYLYDTPWFDALVKKLETKKFKAYRIDPRGFVETTDAEGKPVTDHQIALWDYENAAKGLFKKIYFTGGLIFDLARAKKIQALKAKLPPPPPPEIVKRMILQRTSPLKSVSWGDYREKDTQYRIVMEVLPKDGKFVPGSAKVGELILSTLQVLEDEKKNWKIEESSESRALFVRVMPAEKKPRDKTFVFSGRFQPSEKETAGVVWKVTSTLGSAERETVESEK